MLVPDEPIGDLGNETVFMPSSDDHDEHAHEQMQMGKGPENDLRDPWFRTDEGRAWLADQGEEG